MVQTNDKGRNARTIGSVKRPAKKVILLRIAVALEEIANQLRVANQWQAVNKRSPWSR